MLPPVTLRDDIFGPLLEENYIYSNDTLHEVLHKIGEGKDYYMEMHSESDGVDVALARHAASGRVMVWKNMMKSGWKASGPSLVPTFAVLGSGNVALNLGPGMDKVTFTPSSTLGQWFQTHYADQLIGAQLVAKRAESGKLLLYALNIS